MIGSPIMDSWGKKEKMDWEQFANETDRHGDIEIHSVGIIQRGPIKEVRIEGGMAVITTEWTAEMPSPMARNGRAGNWKLTAPQHNETRLSVSNIQLGDIDNGRFACRFADITIIIFPKDGSRLDSRRVEGHPTYDRALTPPTN
jgi:hypothetical protein